MQETPRQDTTSRSDQRPGAFPDPRFADWLQLKYQQCTKCATGRKRSGNRCREEVCQVQRFVIQSLGLLADGAHRLQKKIGRRMTFSTAGPQEKRRFCTSTFCSDSTLQRHVSCEYFSFSIRRSHSGHYHHLFHHQHRCRRRWRCLLKMQDLKMTDELTAGRPCVFTSVIK